MVRALVAVSLALSPAPQTCREWRVGMRNCTYDVVRSCDATMDDLPCWRMMQLNGRYDCSPPKVELPPDGRIMAAKMIFEELMEQVQYERAEASAAEGR